MCCMNLKHGETVAGCSKAECIEKQTKVPGSHLSLKIPIQHRTQYQNLLVHAALFQQRFSSLSSQPLETIFLSSLDHKLPDYH